ncbi:hypothetical protein GCM10010967_02830 [Dyadobacter beijingensis]|uniref:Gingipain domain-containing protein n=1 Tax=Dyadobacter beijingensis TaxID=365489 RepID=A0ABQ2HE26_9BACT|nr:C25 family cysteine peptidase [Dyadobacter beijingensis]GGM74787.1 hypothetical protein GCM10010967_02830 [Dyadobacter beijingensis]
MFNCIHTNAQPQYGNEWIGYGQQYLRIPVTENGAYKITGRELAAYGIPVDSVLAGSIQLFRRGSEQAIEVAGAAAGMLGTEGYIVFAGQKNDGTTDSALYTSPGAMPHAFYNLYSDTAACFLTWNSGKQGLRTHFPKPGTITDTAAIHTGETLQLFTSHYLPGRFFPEESDYQTGSLRTAYDEGEGWTGPPMATGVPFEMVFQTDHLFRDGQANAACEILLAGWSPGVHVITIWLGTTGNLQTELAEIAVTGRETKRIALTLPVQNFDAHGRVTLALLPTATGGQVSVSYAWMRYPQAGPRVAPAYKQTLPGRIVHFKPIDPQTEYLIVTHPLMRVPVGGCDPVAEYAGYRASEKGGGYWTAVMYSHELYDQFNAGQAGPQGIRNAIRWLAGQKHLKFVLLAGRSVDPQKARKMKDSWQVDMVPNAGWPGSDIALVMDENDSGPYVAIGRVNALTSRQLLDYLRKVQALEAEPRSAAWRKRIMHLSGGRSWEELTLFKSYTRSFEQKLKNTPLARKVVSISKLTDNAVEEVRIDEPVNDGLALVTLFGHSSIDVTDIDIGHASDPARNYQNHPRYPAIIVNGCAAGSIFYATQTLSSDWIFAPERGAVLFLAHTFNGPSTALKRYTDIFYEVLADTAFTSQPFGIIQQEAIRRNMLRAPTTIDRITTQQMTLHGDPAVRIFPAPNAPDASDSTAIPRLPPLLAVTFDGRPLVHDETVSPNTQISIRIFDDHLPLAAHDTTFISVWLKRHCTGCTHERISLRNASGLNAAGSYYEITFPLALEPGDYTFTVQCRDGEGNAAAPYQIRFKVPSRPSGIKVTVSPNPSAQWFRFAIYHESPDDTDLELCIADQSGTTVFRKLLHCHTGLNEYFWWPGALSPAFYHYTVGSTVSAGNKVPILEGARGHLLYAP